MCFEVAGTLLGILVYTLYYSLLADKRTGDCTEAVAEPNTGVRRAYRYHALTLGVLIVIFIVITFLGVKEQKGEGREEGMLDCIIMKMTLLTALPPPHTHTHTHRGDKNRQENWVFQWSS